MLKYQHLIDSCAGDALKLAELALILTSAGLADAMLARKFKDLKLATRNADMKAAIEAIELIVLGAVEG